MLDHIGIVVDNLEKAIQTFSKAFGLKLSQRSSYPELGIEVAILVAKNVKLEFIQPIGPGPYWNAGKITPHFNHIAFDANTIASYKKRMTKAGVSLLAGKRKIGKGAYLMNVDSKDTLGLPIQLISRRA